MKKYFKDILDVYGIKKDFITAFLLDFIIIYIDVKNLFSIIHKNNYISLLILFLLIIITSFLNTKEIKLLISKSINHIDSLIITFFISLIGLLINQFLTEIVFYKLILIIIFILLNIILFIIRIKCINKTISQGYNVYDLKYLCDNPIDISSGGILLLEEKEVYYDLLNRNRIINQLYNVIIRCSPKETFTIGLQGAWGDGKTTIINNVISLIEKNRLMQNFVIVKFNPWDYDNEKAMLKGIIDRVLNEINLSSKLENIEELIDNLIDIVFYNGKNNIGSIFKISKNDIASKTKIENLVNKYLKNHNKKLLLIIDNMDRINTSKINFLLKCSASIINFEQTILVLSYDEKIIETKLDKKFGTKGKKFLDKIIQLKIDVPKIDFKCLEIIKNKLSNNITYNGEQILKNIFTSHLIFDSIRELKIFLNGFFISVGDGDSLNCLNIADMVKLDFIKSKNAELYYDIFENKDYYIIDDRHYEKEIFSINYDDLNKRAKNYFSKLFSNKKNEEFKEILIELFPSVKNYFNKLKIFDIDNRDKIEYYNGITEYKIYNARYFDLYFTKTENEFIWINKEVDKIIKLINTQSIKNFEQKIIEITNKFEFDELKLYMEIFELKINNINKNKKLDVLLSLLKNKNRFHDRILFIGLDSMKRCEIIISK